MLDWRHARSQRSLATNHGGSALEPCLLVLPLEPEETCSSPGRACVKWRGWGAGVLLSHRRGGGGGGRRQESELYSLRTGASGLSLCLRSPLSESSRRLVPQLPHPRSGPVPSPPIHQVVVCVGSLALWEPFSKHVALHEVALTRSSLLLSLESGVFVYSSSPLYSLLYLLAA